MENQSDFMSSTFYKAAATGDVDYLDSHTESDQINDHLSLTPEENNCLHIAARYGHDNFVRQVLTLCPTLAYQQNKRGDNPLHVAARAGHLRIVKLLTDNCGHLLQQPPQTSHDGNESRGNRALSTSIEGIQPERSSLPREAPREAEEGETTVCQNQDENSSTAFTDLVQPRQTSPSTVNSSTVTASDDVISALREAEEGVRPARPTWMIETQQNSTMGHLNDSIQPHQSSRIRDIVTTETTPPSEGPSLPIICTSQNHVGNTPLHEALRSKHEDVALHLLDLEPKEVILVVNAKNESPLFLAAEAGFIHALKKILRVGGNTNPLGPMGQTPMHAAVFAGNTECIQVLHKWNPGLLKKRDLYGKTAVYYASNTVPLNVLRLLLKLDNSCAYICDNDGLSPLLVAASINVLAKVRVILDACPASIESTDNSGNNALHLAIINNTVMRFRRLLKMPEMMTLINEPNEEGNTPLHLAIMSHKYSIVRMLLATKRVDLSVINNLGQTAKDLSALSMGISSTRQGRIWKKLKARKARWGRVRHLFRYRLPSLYYPIKTDATDLKQQINTLSVVAALLATITFAAVLQIPGGYNGDGSPSLIHKPALAVFYLSDTISLCFSILGLLPLINATRSDVVFLRTSLEFSQTFVVYGLYLAMIAFISGSYAVISKECLWLAILVCILCSGLPFLRQWIIGITLTHTPFTPGFLRRQITTNDPLIREQGP